MRFRGWGNLAPEYLEDKTMSLQVLEWLGTPLNGSIGATATRIFSTPARNHNDRARTGFLIACCDVTATDILYVSNHSDLSVTDYWYAILASDPQPQYIPWNLDSEVWILGSVAAVTYRAQEIIASWHPWRG